MIRTTFLLAMSLTIASSCQSTEQPRKRALDADAPYLARLSITKPASTSPEAISVKTVRKGMIYAEAGCVIFETVPYGDKYLLRASENIEVSSGSNGLSIVDTQTELAFGPGEVFGVFNEGVVVQTGPANPARCDEYGELLATNISN